MVTLTELPNDPDVFLSLEPEELGLAMLNLARKHTQNGKFHPGSEIPMPPELGAVGRDRVEQVMAEAWDWLRRQGLILPAPGINGTHGWMIFSRRGAAMLMSQRFDQFREAAQFPKALLHPAIAEKVWVQLARGELQDAVFFAFRTVEESVRTAAGYAHDDVGVNMLRRAFNPDTGPLTKKSDPMAEREGLMQLFAGAILSYKNPHSHRTVTLQDPKEAQEIVLFASHLLRIVDSRLKPNMSADGP